MNRSHIFWWSVIGILCSIALFGCNERERTNPFDPHNDAAVSNPLNLHVRSDTQAVYLDWDASDSPDLTGYNIYRTIQGDSLQLLQELPDSVTSYIDENIQLDTTYVYSLTVRGDVDETSFTMFDTITPGPTRWWILASNYNSLSQFSHDGMHLYTSYNVYGAPEYLVAPAFRNLLYTYDRYNGTLFRHIPGESPAVLQTGIYNVVDMLYGAAPETLFLLRNTGDVEILKLQTNSLQTVEVPKSITAGTINQTGHLWIGAGGTLYSMDGSNPIAQKAKEMPGGQQITAVAANEFNTVAYLGMGSENMIYTWSSGTLTLDTLITDIPYPRKIEYNSHDHSLWILSYTDSKNPYSIYRYDGNVTQLMYSGGKEMYDIAVNPVTDVCLTADYDSGTIIRISPDGEKRYYHEFPGKGYQIVVQQIESM